MIDSTCVAREGEGDGEDADLVVDLGGWQKIGDSFWSSLLLLEEWPEICDSRGGALTTTLTLRRSVLVLAAEVRVSRLLLYEDCKGYGTYAF